MNTVVQINDTAENATDVLDYLVNPENTTVLTQQSNTTVDIGVYLFDNATDGVVVTFTVIATSDTDESVNDFITFDVVTTTLPPPKFTENVGSMHAYMIHVFHDHNSYVICTHAYSNIVNLH